MSRRGREEVYQVHPGGVPPLVVVLKGDLEARWVEEIVEMLIWSGSRLGGGEPGCRCLSENDNHLIFIPIFDD